MAEQSNVIVLSIISHHILYLVSLRMQEKHASILSTNMYKVKWHHYMISAYKGMGGKLPLIVQLTTKIIKALLGLQEHFPEKDEHIQRAPKPIK